MSELHRTRHPTKSAGVYQEGKEEFISALFVTILVKERVVVAKNLLSTTHIYKKLLSTILVTTNVGQKKTQEHDHSIYGRKYGKGNYKDLLKKLL